MVFVNNNSTTKAHLLHIRLTIILAKVLLTYLQVLRISFCGITGSIPSEIGNLQQLRELRLTGNELSGLIPATLGNLTNIEGLFLHYNQR